MTDLVPKEKLTAYQRWEVAAFDEAEQAALSSRIPGNTAGNDKPEGQTPVVLPTAADIEQMHIEAHQQGYSAGYAEGLEQAQKIADQINALMTNLQQSLDALDQHVAEQLLATSVEIANQVLRQSLRIKPEVLIPTVREAIATLHPHPGHPILFAHPDDADLIRTQLGDQLSHNNWRIIEDPAMTPGGCRVELGASEVDATLETRWRRVIESIGISQDWLNDKP